MSGDVRYRRTQFAWPTIAPLVAVAIVIATTFLRAQFITGLWLFAGIFAIVLLLFSTLTVTVTGDSLVAAFGIGLVRKRIQFADVASFAAVRNPWFYGWGIHYFPGGTLYNASGLSAVEFTMASGRYVRIGTGDPAGLVAALEAASARRASEPEAGNRTFWDARHVVGAVIGVIAIVVAAWSFYVGFKPPAVTVTSESIAISNGLYRNNIQFNAIRTATLEIGLPRIGFRSNGFSAGDTLRGSFKLDDWGMTRLYINRDSPPFLVIRTTQDNYVVVNFKDPDQTRALYSELTAAIDRSHR